MTYYLDANVIITIMDKEDRELFGKILSISPNNVKIPSVVAAELIYGAHKSHNFDKRMKILSKFFNELEVIPFDTAAAEIYGKIRSELERNGNVIGPNDLMIAATVLSRGGILVTSNVKEFRRVEGLFVENWCKPSR
jgi:tRNA(fMet)-specific endonuclease VapC